MNGPNGRAHARPNPVTDQSGFDAEPNAGSREEGFSREKVKELVAELEVPFENSAIEWRVTNTGQEGKRGQIVPYADPRAYTDRLNALFTPAGWTRKYSVSTSANFERAKDKKVVAKVLVTCELTIFGLGSHSATGEEFADSEYACTAAEAQAFKRAASCFGLGRYLYYFTGVWVDLDERKQPKNIPQLFDWATPTGWRAGLRPKEALLGASNGSHERPAVANSQTEAIIREIETLAEPLGRGLYRGVLRDVAKVWNPRDIQDGLVQQKALDHMRAAERGLRRLEAALDKVGPEKLIPILKSLGLSSLERVDTLETLKRIVLELERLAQEP